MGDAVIRPGDIIFPKFEPKARYDGERITAKQLGYFRSLCRDRLKDPEEVCRSKYGIAVEELSRDGASRLIDDVKGPVVGVTVEVRRNVRAKRTVTTYVRVEVLPCPGCGDRPVALGSFGRFKFACPRYAARDRETVTDSCVGDLQRPYSRSPRLAGDAWNRAVVETAAGEAGDEQEDTA